MSRTVIGLFDEFRQAQAAVNDLERAGIPEDRISVVANNASDEYNRWRNETGHGNVPNATGQGANVGAATGGIGGILLGLGMLTIPGLGPLAAAGPLVAGLTGAGVGAAAGAATGGLIGMLTDLGVPEEQAGYYMEGIRRGGTLLTVASPNDRVEPIIEILNRDGAIDINRRSAYYHETGYQRYNPSAQPLSAAEVAAERERLRAANIALTPSVLPTDRPIEHEPRTSPAPVAEHMPAPPNAVIPQQNRNTIQNPNGETVLPVVEETLAVGKREVERGGVRVFTRVTEKPVEESVQLREEHVTVDRHPVNRPVNDADMSAFREGTIEVKETAEVPVVTREARIVEEVVIGKQATERTETVRDTVRRTDVEVEQIAGQHRGRFDDSSNIDNKYDIFVNDFRGNYQSQYGSQGGRYEDYEPAYRYGYDIAGDPRYTGRDWNSVQSDLQRDWETRQPGTWNRFSNAIHYAWDRAANSMQNGIQTGGHAMDGTPDTRGVVEKVSDAVTGDRIDDKTGKVVR